MLKILSLRNEFKKSLKNNWQQRLKYQSQRFDMLLKHAKTIPFWEERLKTCKSIKDLQQVPPITKSELMENFDSILKSTGVTKNSVMDFFAQSQSAATMSTGHFALRTSGTSGVITCIVIDEEDAHRMLSSSIVFGTVPSNFGTITRAFVGKKLKVASIILESGHFPGTFYSHLMKRFVKIMNTVASSNIVDIGQPVHNIIDMLNKMNADVWVSYPSMLRVLAKEAKNGSLKVKPKHIICTSEPLDSYTHNLAIEQFTDEIHNVYGSGECPFIATTCSMKNFHLRPEACIFENVDENNHPVPPGTCGDHVLVTNLNAYTLPMIRFILEDRVTVSEKTCTCGDCSPLLECIDGRTDDIFWLKNTMNEEIPIHPCAFEPPLINDFRVEEYQIVHDIQNHIIIRIASKNKELSQTLPQVFNDHLCHLELDKILQVDFEFCEEISRQISGKFRRFVSQVPRLSL